MAPKPPRSRTMGYALGFCGLAFVLINYITLMSSDTYFPKLLLTGIILFFLGLGMVFFPPYAANMNDQSTYFKEVFQKTPMINKLMWLVFIGLGVVAIVLMMDYYNFVLF